MTTVPVRPISVERFSVSSSASFETIMARLEREIGHPKIAELYQAAAAARTLAEVEALIKEAVGPSGLMEFVRFDMGMFLGKEPGAKPRQSLRLLIGNPLIMKEMAKHVADACSYAPVTVLIDERADGVYLSYDRMASFLASYGNSEALKVARDLDTKVEALLSSAAR